MLLLATDAGFTVDSLDVSCPGCEQGIAFNATSRELHAMSTKRLTCPREAAVSNDMAQRCTCADYQTTLERFADQEVVSLIDIMHTCSFCEPHMQYWEGTCRKCAVYNAWSDGKSDVCHMWPQDNTQLAAILAAATSCIFLVFIFFQILQAPLVILDAKSVRTPHGADGKDPSKMERSFTIALQGPIVAGLPFRN